jgi:DNA-directed RNA polymerase specialized sigma24 family protein
MGFNYTREKRRFDADWRKLALEYAKAGMSAAAIQTMHDYDWEQFRRRRTYENRIQGLPSEAIDPHDEECNSTLFRLFPALTVSFDESDFTGRHDWIETVDDMLLAGTLSSLPICDKELLTLLVMDGYSQTEIAVMYGCKQSVISRKIKRIKNLLSRMA